VYRYTNETPTSNEDSADEENDKPPSWLPLNNIAGLTTINTNE